MRVALAVVAVVAGVLAAPAAAHIVVSPQFLPVGGSGLLTLEVPNERNVLMTGVEVTMPAGLTADEAVSSAGFEGSVDGDTVTWQGGSLAPEAIVQLELRATAGTVPGDVTLAATQRFSDDKTQDWDVRFTVTPESGPAPEQHPGRAIVAAVLGVAVIAGSLVLLRRFRRGRTSR